MKIRKAVITAAGFGTRFLPITRSQPKEMLPLIDKPLIQYSVEEAIESGINQIIIVTATGKRAIEDYFDRPYALEDFLKKKKETDLLDRMDKISRLIDICYIRQKEQKGLGDAVLMAKDIVGDEPFALMLPDDIIDSKVPCLKQMLAVFNKYNSSVVAVEYIKNDEDFIKYGVINPKQVGKRTYKVSGMVEKPKKEEAPSRFGIVGRYLLTPRIFTLLEKAKAGKNGEIQLTDSLNKLCKSKVYAYELKGTRYDAGTPLGWLQANVDLALKRDDIGAEFKAYLKKLR